MAKRRYARTVLVQSLSPTTQRFLRLQVPSRLISSLAAVVIFGMNHIRINEVRLRTPRLKVHSRGQDFYLNQKMFDSFTLRVAQSIALSGTIVFF